MTWDDSNARHPGQRSLCARPDKSKQKGAGPCQPLTCHQFAARYPVVAFTNRCASRDFRRAACRLWMTPFVTALSSSRDAVFTRSAAFSSFPAMAARDFRISVLIRDLQLLFRRRFCRDRTMSFFDDLMFAN